MESIAEALEGRKARMQNVIMKSSSNKLFSVGQFCPQFSEIEKALGEKNKIPIQN
jgi:hypothetical protein